MSYFTPADAEYIKGSVRKIVRLSDDRGLTSGFPLAKSIAERDAEIDRLLTFIDGCTATTRGETK